LPSTHATAERARQIHSSSLVFDTHVDTPQRLLFQHLDLSKPDAEGCVDIPRMRQGNIGAIIFALWVPVKITGHPATQRVLDLLAPVLQQIERHPNDLMLAKTVDDIRAARAQGKIAVLLGVEGGHAINNSLDVLRDFFARGIRTMTLTHNATTDWADSSNDAAKHGGLTAFGRGVIEEMNRLGMLVDVSHVSDKAFFDVLDVSKAPVAASHSCCRALSAAPRNLSDEMIKALAAQGGVVHIAFHLSFLSQEYLVQSRLLEPEFELLDREFEARFKGDTARTQIEWQRLTRLWIREGRLPGVHWEKILDHIDHAVALVGAEHVGLGSDFDGAYMPEGMEDVAEFPRITEGLLRRGYSETDIRNILGENSLRVMGEVEKFARAYGSGKG
jgi:membrane dipeptidase